jgi:hypothetical protein
VLEDEGQAQIVLSKMRSSCEAIFVTAQRRSAANWRCVLTNWKIPWPALQ